MACLLIIAGPQSSGKTTVFNLLKNYLIDDRQPDKRVAFLSEINPYCFVNKNHLGAAFVDKKLQIAIANADLKRIQKIIDNNFDHDRGKSCDKTYLIETGIFGLVYFEHILGRKKAEIYFKKYLEMYKHFSPIILFIDTKPEISWKRRKPKYLERIKNSGVIDPKKKAAMLKKYRGIIDALYPLWLKWYKKFPFEKYMIRNSYKTERAFLKEIVGLCKKYTTVDT